MQKLGLTKKEARGVILLLIIITFIIGYKIVCDRIDQGRARELSASLVESIPDSISLFEFDPNSIDLADLMRLGLTKAEAVSIIRYRSYGKVFRIKEDLFTCYGISDSIYYALEPYIVIADSLRPQKSYSSSQTESSKPVTSRYKRQVVAPSPFLVDTVGVQYLVSIGALTRRQAETFVKWRNRSGIYNMEELCDCYVISDSLAAALEPYLIFTPYTEPQDELVDLNRADSVTLRSVYGIGEKSVMAILDYRQKLGGFYSADQLSELKVVTESNFEKIIRQISCDSCDISKIDVNFATAKRMKGHPYIADRALRRLLKIRELKGGWSTIEEMITDNIFNIEEATRVRPYLLFGEFELRDITDKQLF